MPNDPIHPARAEFRDTPSGGLEVLDGGVWAHVPSAAARIIRAAAPHPPALTVARKAAVLAERDACVSAALSARFGPPSMWGSGNPRGWHLDQECLPWDASMHDNGCVDAAKAIRARSVAPKPGSGV